MSRYVRVYDSAYNLVVNPAGTITLDTGNQQGTVLVTGDLVVKGNTTTVESETVVVKDNVIVINQQSTGNGIALGYAGIEIDRGEPALAPAAQLFFDESLVWYDSQSGTNVSGSFVFKKANTNLVGIRTNSITTGDNDLDLVFLSPSGAGGTATLSVSGVYNYEDRVTDDDDIPNAKWVTNTIASYFSTNPPNTITEGNSKLRIYDDEISGSGTRLDLTLDGVIVSQYKLTETTFFQNAKLSSSAGQIVLETTLLNSDLVLRASGTGSVTVDDDLKLNTVSQAPAYETGGTKVYVQQEASGGTGIYFVNSDQTRDELVSRRRAITYSMIF